MITRPLPQSNCRVPPIQDPLWYKLQFEPCRITHLRSRPTIWPSSGRLLLVLHSSPCAIIVYAESSNLPFSKHLPNLTTWASVGQCRMHIYFWTSNQATELERGLLHSFLATASSNPNSVRSTWMLANNPMSAGQRFSTDCRVTGLPFSSWAQTGKLTVPTKDG